MTIVSIKTGTGEGLRRLELSDGSFFWLKTCYLQPVFLAESFLEPGMAEGREISDEEEGAFRFASACLRAEKAALRLIARAEQCFFGLSRKLKLRGHNSACIHPVIARLGELGLVDDRRFARLWLESRLYRAASPRRLLAGLYSRGIDRDDAEAAQKAVLDDTTEFALLERFARKRLRGMANKPRFALKSFLKSEGFSSAAIGQYLEQLFT